MNKQTLAVIVGAVLLFAIAVIGALAFTGSDDSNGNVHTMPGGQTMTEPMTDETDGMHTMPEGDTMSDTEMTP